MDFIGLLCLILAASWALAVVALSVAAKSRVSAINHWLIALVLACCGLWLVPYEQWKLLMVRAYGTQHVPKDWIVWAGATVNYARDVRFRARYCR
jgi:hypothetical protein